MKAEMFQEVIVEVEVTEEAQRAVTSRSISALSVTSLVTSRRIIRRKMMTPRKLSLRSMQMQVLWWFVVERMKKVMFLSLVMMLCRAVIV